MPVYEYQCKACHKEFEYQQRMSDPDKTLCEACGAEALERLISRTAFTLKGGGWYKDLYASAKPEAKSSDAAGTSPAKSDTSSTPAAAAPAKSDAGGGSSSSGGSSTPSSSGGSSSSGGGTSTAAASPAK